MSIFNKRPLSIILTFMLGGFVVFTVSSAAVRYILIAISILPCIIPFILKFDKYNKIYSVILSCVLLLSFLLSHLYFDVDFKIYNKFKGESDITATVEEIKPSSSYSTGIVVKTKTINEMSHRGYRIICYINSDEARALDIGDTVCFTTYISDFADSDSRSYNYSRGISARAIDIYNFTIVSHGGFNLTKTFSFYREYISRYSAMLSDSDTAALLSALLLGERDDLSPKTRLDFKRIGISHILALSGMHLSILSLGITSLLTLLRVKKKTRTVTLIAFVSLYMALTGFSVSVVRSGLMLIISSLLFLLSKSKDSITSLITAVFIICLVSPYAIYDVALWLSAFATLGILVLSEYLKESKLNSSVKRPLVYVYASLLCTVFAVSATLLISTVTFGGISLFSLISTFIFSILTEIIMYLGCIMLIIGWLIPIKYLLIPLCGFTTKLAEIFSSSKFAYYSNNNTLSMILVIILTLLIFIFAVFKIRNKKRFVILLCSFYIITTITPLVQTVVKTFNTESVIYYSESKCDEFLIRSNSETCLINSSQYSKSKAYSTKDLLDEHGITYIDKYLITHYGFNLRDDFEVILSSYVADCIYLPMPQNDDEESILSLLKKIVEEYSAKIIVYENETEVMLGNAVMTPLLNTAYGEDTSMNAFKITIGEDNILYLSSGVLETTDKDIYYNYMLESDQIIFGSHGKKYKKKIYLEDIGENLERLIFSSPNLYITQNSMIDQTEKGCEILSHPKEIELLN